MLTNTHSPYSPFQICIFFFFLRQIRLLHSFLLHLMCCNFSQIYFTFSSSFLCMLQNHVGMDSDASYSLISCVMRVKLLEPTTWPNSIAQGACKFGFYEFFKKYYYDIAGPEYIAKHKTLIYLAGSASAEVIADVALCPFEAVKVPVHLSFGLACGLAGLFAGMAIGIVGDVGEGKWFHQFRAV